MLSKRILGILILTALVFIESSARDIDALADSYLKEHSIEKSQKASDAAFCRRLYLVTTSALPTVEKLQSFLESKDSKKREKLVDELIGSDLWVDDMVLKWGDLLRIKSEFPSCIWPNGVQAYNRFLKKKFRDNCPYDKLVTTMLTGTGSNFRNPEINFFRAHVTRSPKEFCQDIALIFMCQRDYPKSWEKFFTQVKFKSTKEWKEEILILDIDAPAIGNVSVGGTSIKTVKGEDYRIPFAQWLTSSANRQFARAFVNRTWYWLMGQALTSEVDNMKADEKSDGKDILEYLTDEFIKSGYDIQSLNKMILKSEVFSLSSVTTAKNEFDKTGFSHYIPHRMTAEQISDAISDVTGNYDIFASRAPEPYTKYPKGTRSIQIGDGTVTTSELELFGRPSRDVSTASSRVSSYNYKQVMYLLNSDNIIKKLLRNRNLTEVIYDKSKTREDIIDYLYMLFLSRHATRKEMMTIAEMSGEVHYSQLCEDLSIALLSSNEFLFIH